MLKTRVLTALVLVPLTLWALFGLTPRGWAVVTLLVVAIAASEWADLAGLGRPWGMLFVAGTAAAGVCLLVAAWVAPAAGVESGGGWTGGVVPIVCGLATLFWVLIAPFFVIAGWRVDSKIVLASLGLVLLLAVWVAIVDLRARSPSLLLALMAIVWIADTAAYFAGRRFGRRKLAPAISPGKTWEGVYGALIAIAVYAAALVPFADAAGYPGSVSVAAVGAWIALALLLAGVSIVGDLFESQLKRRRGVKDSGRVLPGHGGILDRIDALTAAMPPAALMAHYLLR